MTKEDEKKAIPEHFDKLWRKYTKQTLIGKFISFLGDRQAVKILLSISPETILDVGCGLGRTMLEFKRSGFKVVGIDTSDESIAICKEKGLEAYEMDILQNSFSDSSFDVVFADGLLEHFEDYEPFVKEMVRVSRKYILLIQPNCHSLAGKILNIIIYKILKNKKGQPIEFPHKRGDYIESFEKYDCKLATQKGAACESFTVFLFQKNS